MNHYFLLSVAFLLVMVVGLFFYLRYEKGIKQFQDYLSVNRSIGTAPLVIALITITISGSFLQVGIGSVSIYGISVSVMESLYYSIIPLFFAYAIFPRLLRLQNTHSLGGIIQHMYGRLAAAITSFVASIICCWVIRHQLIRLTHISLVFGKYSSILLILAGMIGIVQALWISNHRVSTISIVQFILIIGLLFSLATLVIYLEEVKAAGGGLQGLLQAIKNNLPTQQERLLSYKPLWSAILNIFNLPVLLLYPPIIQRVLINKDNRQMKNAFKGYALFHICFRLLIVIIGLGAVLVSIKNNGATFSKFDIILSALSQNGWAGLCYSYLVLISSIGIISYFLHSLSVELSENIIKPYSDKNIKHDNSLVKFIILAVGAFCTFLALLSQQDYYHLLLPFIIFMYAMLAPFIIGCIGLKGNNTIFIIGVVTFYITTAALLWAIRYGYFPIKEGLALHRQIARTNPLALLASGLAVLVAHYWTYDGFQKRKVKAENAIRKVNQKESFGAMLSNPLLWAKDKLERYDNNPTAIGGFLLFILVLPSLAGSNGLPVYNGPIVFVVRIVGMSLATIMMFHNFFPYFLKKIFPLLWFLTLGYCIPFSHIFFILCSPHNIILVVKLALLLLFLRIITDKRTFFILTCMGLLGAYYCYRKWIPSHIAVLSFQESWNIAEVMTLVMAIIISFISYQERVNSGRIRKNQTLASGFSHDLRNLFQYTDWMVANEYNYQSIVERLQVLKNKPNALQREPEMLDELIKNARSISQFLKESLRECQVFYELVRDEYINHENIKEMDIKEFIEETRSFVPSSFQKKVKIRVKKPIKVMMHPTILRSTLLNLIKNGFKHGGSKNVTVGWDYRRNCLYIEDYGKGIDPEKEPYVFDLYYTTGGSGVGLPFIKTMLEKVGASILFKTSPKGTTFFIYLPIAKEKKNKRMMGKQIWSPTL